MSDVFNEEKRSEVMAKVKATGNASTELALIKLFRKFKLTGWRRKQKLFGKPDFVFSNEKVAVFADGCFWHGHNCKNITPKQNAQFWRDKLARNKKRDRLVNRILKKEGWIVFRIWECAIKKGKLPKKLIFLLKSEK